MADERMRIWGEGVEEQRRKKTFDIVKSPSAEFPLSS